ncbi:MAG: FAD:protein FMN transferase [Phycisphaeraceae bacterium]|nr:FAD:protein FMN transferase [Phycisphaeraceae bacterium]
MHRPWMNVLTSGMVLLAWVASASGQTPLARYECTRIVMGVAARVVFFAQDEAAARQAERAVYARLNHLDAVMSDYRKDSELMLLCSREAGVWHEVSDDLCTVLWWAKDLADLSSGAFDPTVGPTVRLWRAARQSGEIPDANELEAARQVTGHELMEVDVATRRVRLAAAGMSLDLGGIGKGFAADEALRTLAELGIASALIDLGGDITVSHPPPGEAGWRVRVEAGSTDAIELIVAHAAVATSGDREQFVIIAGERFSHIIDPRDGHALTHNAATTVIARSGTLADALASAACVLAASGDEQTLASLSARFDEAWMRVTAHGRSAEFGTLYER